MWRHMQPHKFLNTSQLEWEMLLNYKFAQVTHATSLVYCIIPSAYASCYATNI